MAFRSRRLQRVFAEVRAHRDDVEFFVLPSVEDLPAGNGLATAAPPSQGWGWFRSKFRVRGPSEAKDAVDLLLASYRERRRMNRRIRGGRGKSDK